jgi:hypothetical protein
MNRIGLIRCRGHTLSVYVIKPIVRILVSKNGEYITLSQ